MLKTLKNKKTLIIIAILVILFSFFFYQSQKNANGQDIPKFEPEKDEVVSPKVMDLDETITLAGKIDAVSKADVRFQTSGRLAWVGVKVGDSVHKWQSLASLDKIELRKSLEKQFNDYKSQLDTFQDVQDTYKTEKENFTLTDEMQRILNRSQNGLNNSVIAYELADLAVKYATIWSPINGIVVGVDQPNAGINITPASASFLIIDPNSIYFKSEIDEEDVSRIYLGQKTQITIDTFPDNTFESEISYISFSPVVGQASTVYEVRFKLDIDNQDLKYRLGMNGDAAILISQAPKAIVLPIEAVNQDSDGKYYVYTLNSQDQVEIKNITTGIETDNNIQIISGISENEKILIKQ
jgi:RND family efflux transporter MFP subunit